MRPNRANYRQVKTFPKPSPELQYFAFVNKKIINRNLKRWFKTIHDCEPKAINKLKCISEIAKRKTKQAFFQIYDCQSANKPAIDPKQKSFLFGCQVLGNFHKRRLASGMEGIMAENRRFELKEQLVKVIVKKLQSSFDHYTAKVGFSAIKKEQMDNEKRKYGIQLISKRFNDMQQRRIKQMFEILIKDIFQKNYAYLFKMSDEMRRRASNMENEKKSRISMEKMNFNKRKAQIQTSKKNQNFGNMKKETSIKIIKAKQTIKSDIQLLEDRKKENQKLKNLIFSLQNIHSNRIYLSKQAQKQRGAYERVARLYTRIELEEEASRNQPKILKERFKHHMNFSALKQLSEFYGKLYLIRNKQICHYENTPLQILHISKEYARVKGENETLKESVETLIEFELKRDKDKEISSDFQELQSHFQSLMAYEEENSVQGPVKSASMKSTLRTSGSYY